MIAPMARIDPYLTNQRLEKVLLETRKSKGLTQIDVAMALKKPQSFVSKYETGERKLTVGDFLAVCEALQVQPHKILAKIK